MAGKGDNQGEVDLFGAPIDQVRERWGRPSFAKTQYNQQYVAILVSAGWKADAIARHIGCDPKTLRKHFSRELRAGADMIEADMMAALYAKARQGNVGAITKVLDLIENKGRPRPPALINDKPAPKGKKETLADHASAPPNSWADRLQ